MNCSSNKDRKGHKEKGILKSERHNAQAIVNSKWLKTSFFTKSAGSNDWHSIFSTKSNEIGYNSNVHICERMIEKRRALKDKR